MSACLENFSFGMCREVVDGEWIGCYGHGKFAPRLIRISWGRI